MSTQSAISETSGRLRRVNMMPGREIGCAAPKRFRSLRHYLLGSCGGYRPTNLIDEVMRAMPAWLDNRSLRRILAVAALGVVGSFAQGNPPAPSASPKETKETVNSAKKYFEHRQYAQAFPL